MEQSDPRMREDKLRLIPIPTTPVYIKKSTPHWYPFLEGISRRSKQSVAELFAKVAGGDVQPILVWDEVAKKAVALVGMQYHRRGDDLIAEWVWMTGKGMKQWQGLLPELERYLKQHVGCAQIRPICRPGWSRFLKTQGYRVTHYTMEKVL
jgi:hypothetical protein